MPAFTKEKIIEQFRSVHGDRYDYSLLEYYGDQTKVKIICKEHGAFEQWVSSHKQGRGCRKCALTSLKPRYTTEQIIEQFKKKHGDRFDYSKVNYTHALNKVKIICRNHGEFEQLVGMHRKGQGCAQCMYDDKRHSLGEVIHKFNEIHCNKYDYSQATYVNTDTKIKIKCQEHGVFEQTPEKHLRGNGCPKCIGRHRTQDEIIAEFAGKHGNTYGYDQVRFTGMNNKVVIICHVHGGFYQKPRNHINGQGCPKCAATAKLSNDEIIEKFKITHGDNFDYSEAIYVNTKTAVKIICNKHGAFYQLPHLHANGSGCQICAGNYRLDTETIIKHFREVHGNTYDYSRMKYTSAFGHVEIICPIHGVFTQIARSHKRGSGCPECVVTIGHTKNSYIEYCNQYDGKTHLYLIYCFNEKEQFYKVGISRLGAKQRFDSSLKMPYKFKVIAEIYGDVSLIWDLEKNIHKLLYKFKYKPKLQFHGKTECFDEISQPVYKLINNFNNDCQLKMLM